MDVSIKKIVGNWNDGYALDKHIVSSKFLGNNQFGHPEFDTTRTEVGEAVYQLKYKSKWSNSEELAMAVLEHIIPKFPAIGLIVPMPASQIRTRQPVNEVANELAKLMELTAFDNIIVKSASESGKNLKDLNTKAEKVAELDGRFSINDGIKSEGKWNALLLDDLFDSGASMEAATATLLSYQKIKGVYAVALTWK
jgi:predicted amidophosphoribosyltransferase